MNYRDIHRIVSKFVRGSLGQMQYRVADFDLVKMEENTPYLEIAKNVGGLWVVSNPLDEQTERYKAWSLRWKHDTLFHHPAFDVPGLDRPRGDTFYSYLE